MTDPSTPTFPTPTIPIETLNTYQVFMSGFVEPQLFVDDDPFPVVLNRWLIKRQTFDKLESDYEKAMEAYEAAMDKAESLGDGASETPERPAKLTLTEDLLMTFTGNKDGRLGGAVFVGNIMGIRLV